MFPKAAGKVCHPPAFPVTLYGKTVSNYGKQYFQTAKRNKALAKLRRKTDEDVEAQGKEKVAKQTA